MISVWYLHFLLLLKFSLFSGIALMVSVSIFMTFILNSLSGKSLISILWRSVFRLYFVLFWGHVSSFSWTLSVGFFCVLIRRLFQVWCAGHVQGLNIIFSLVQVLGWLSNLVIVHSHILCCWGCAKTCQCSEGRISGSTLQSPGCRPTGSQMLRQHLWATQVDPFHRKAGS